MSDVLSHITFHPNTNVTFIKAINSTSITMNEALAEKDKMKTNTILLTKYGKMQLDASYFSMLSDSGQTIFTIYKKVPNQEYYQYVCTLSGEDYKFTDYNIVSNQFYHYLASAELPNTADGGGNGYITYENISTDYETNYIHTVFDGWSICDIEPVEDEENMYKRSSRVWNLGLNIEDESLTLNTNVTTWDTLGQYPKFSIGARKYKSMTFTGLLGKMQEYTAYTFPEKGNISTATTETVYGYTEKMVTYNNAATDDENTKYDERWGVWDPYARETEKLAAWDDFISDGELKLLKDLKGHAWIVQVSESSTSKINIASSLQQTTVSFTWKEALDIDDISIILFGENTED